MILFFLISSIFSAETVNLCYSNDEALKCSEGYTQVSSDLTKLENQINSDTKFVNLEILLSESSSPVEFGISALSQDISLCVSGNNPQNQITFSFGESCKAHILSLQLTNGKYNIPNVADFQFGELLLNENSNLNLNQITIQNKTQVSPNSTLELSDSKLENSVFNFLYDKDMKTNVTLKQTTNFKYPSKLNLYYKKEQISNGDQIKVWTLDAPNNTVTRPELTCYEYDGNVENLNAAQEGTAFSCSLIIDENELLVSMTETAEPSGGVDGGIIAIIVIVCIIAVALGIFLAIKCRRMQSDRNIYQDIPENDDLKQYMV